MPSVTSAASGIDAWLNSLPDAHPVPATGRRMAGCDAQGFLHRPKAAADSLLAARVRSARFRFVYFPVVSDHDAHAAYHRNLVIAEVLLDRVLAARHGSTRPIVPSLGNADEARAMVRPPRDLFHQSTLEYRRWYHDDGTARAQPLTREALVARLAIAGLSVEQARDRAAHRSHALPSVDQAWLLNRRNTPLDQRPLDEPEFHALVRAIEDVWQVPSGAPHVLQANRQIALRVAAMLASLLDEYVAPPFSIAALNDAFNEQLVAHLRQTIEATREAGSVSFAPLVGPKAWFAAKAARMRAEHQIGLALLPAAAASSISAWICTRSPANEQNVHHVRSPIVPTSITRAALG
jgi:hypothetical protein